MPNQLGDLDGQVALVTGGAGGLGSEAAGWLAAAGARVVVADVSAASLDRAAERIGRLVPDAAGRLRYTVLDVTDSAAVRDCVAGLESSDGRLDILLTSHGFPRDRRLRDMTDGEWNDVISVCLTGTFLCVREASRPMVAQGYGRIITVASRAWQGNPGQANYSAAKAGVVGLTKSVAKELGRHGVTANAIAPGLVDTPSLRELATFDQIAERAIRDNSIKRIGQPGDVAAAVLYLASPQAGFITGEVLHVSGGRFS
jgi:3-oxoacyl-[acyl-carrier protein] reductase